MRKIYKYKLKSGDDGGVTIVEGRIKRFLKIDWQESTRSIVLWAEIDDDYVMQTFYFDAIGTGWNYDQFEFGEYFGSAEDRTTGYVWHYFYWEVV